MQVLRISFSRDRMKLDVQMEAGEPCLTTSEIANRALAIYPTLNVHSCINSAGPTFGSVIEHTSIPHLLEHMIIAEQVERANRPELSYVGTTEWIDEAHIARIEVRYSDDLDAVSALHDALENLHRVL